MTPRLLALSTAVPPIVLRQEDVVARVTALFDNRRSEIARMMPVFDNAGIATRYSCVPVDWFDRDHGWSERQKLYTEHAVALLERTATETLRRADLRPEEVDGIVTVSTTGIATPSLDARLMERMRFRRDVIRLPIFGLGCAGGVLGMARAAALARAQPGARILMLIVELCSLTFRKADQSKSNIIASALFGDGAAAALIGPAAPEDGTAGRPAIGASGEYAWPDSLDVMGWHVEDDGLGVQFSRDIPTLVRTQFRPVLDDFLASHDLARTDIGAFVCHPGGMKVIAALEDAFEIPPGSLREARDILRNYGNMSAATVLFVLEQMLLSPAPLPRRLLMSALGPGFTAAFQTLDRAG